MSDYRPPVDDMAFILTHVAALDQPGDPQADDVRLILESAGQLAADVLAPLNHTGDHERVSLQPDGTVKTPAGFSEAYRQYREGGWNGIPFSPDFGGQGLPWHLAFAVQEMWQSANMSFGLCPLLNQAAVEAIEIHGSTEQKNIYLAKLVSGEWTGTMQLTEPDAGSDLSTIKTKAEKQADGTYKLKGQKIFITYGEHDLAENIIHTVLARTPDAPKGIKGLSLFIVPKFIPDAGGAPGARNDARCVSLEHKMGIHASPTCTMQYGDAGGATGWLVGKEGEGLKYMFTMMNNARLSVGLQGVAIAERAYQHALAYARQRVQGTKLTGKGGPRVAIVEHPDVRRMLLSMRAQVEAGRALSYSAAKAMDRGLKGDRAAQARAELLTPVVKAWCTDMAVDVASAGIQIHGGMGFIEETGAAQYYRDARILPIYEGANGIQALDLSLRKICGDGGAAARDYFAEIGRSADALKKQPDAILQQVGQGLAEALAELHRATDWVLATGVKNPDAVAAVGVPYLQAFGTVAGGDMLARCALFAPQASNPAFAAAKIATTRFYATHILPRTAGHCTAVLNGSAPVTDCGPGTF